MELPKRKYAVLAIHHGPGSKRDANVVPGVPAGKSVARVRLFREDGTIVDEDLVMPRLITIEEQLDAAMNERFKEIEKGVSAKDSKLVEGEGNVVEVERKKK